MIPDWLRSPYNGARIVLNLGERAIQPYSVKTSQNAVKRICDEDQRFLDLGNALEDGDNVFNSDSVNGIDF